VLPNAKEMREVAGAELTDTILTSTEPLILRGLVKHWPAVQAGLASEQGADAYLRKFYTNATVTAMLGAPEINGRFFYKDDLSGFKFAPGGARVEPF
jgi:hypothetical protein